jgi:hypothetical protein
MAEIVRGQRGPASHERAHDDEQPNGVQKGDGTAAQASSIDTSCDLDMGSQTRASEQGISGKASTSVNVGIGENRVRPKLVQDQDKPAADFLHRRY